MKIALICLLFSGLASASKLRGPVSDDVHTLKEQVTASKVFQSKVMEACDKAQNRAECAASATDKLFCQLITRSKPDMAAKAGCGKESAPATQQASPSTTSFASVKAQIMKSADFQNKADAMAVTLGCTGVKKSQNCVQYVQEAAFCLAFADKMTKFQGMAGEKEEESYCEHIDDKLPALSMLLQKAKRPFKKDSKKKPSFVQLSVHKKAPEDELAKEMTHDLEMNFNKIAPFGKEDTAKELQDHAAKTQDTLVDAVENAEVAEIKRAVFRALTRLRAATIKEFDTIARLETQAIDAYNDAHHYRAENPLTHLHEDEAPVETDKLKSFH